MNINILLALVFGILLLVLGITDTIYAAYDFNKEDKNGLINNNVALVFLFTGVFIIICAIYYINLQYSSLFI